MKNPNNTSPPAPKSVFSSIRIAVCGELPTACEYLLREGVVHIENFSDATEIDHESNYHLILIYAPCAEGLLNTQYSSSAVFEKGAKPIPIRLLNEPCCHSALLELKSTVRRIGKTLMHERPELLDA